MRKLKYLRHEIILILLLKLVLLYIIWAFCFSQPLDKNLTPTQIVSHVFHQAEDV